MRHPSRSPHSSLTRPAGKKAHVTPSDALRLRAAIRAKDLHVISNMSVLAHFGMADAYGWTALHVAAEKGAHKLVSELIRRGARVDQGDNSGWTALHAAAWVGRSRALKVLLRAGARIDASGGDGQTPLYIASVGGKTDAARILLANGASVNATSELGYTSLLIASFVGNIEVIRLLLLYRADPEIRAADGRNALELARGYGHMECATLLERAPFRRRGHRVTFRAADADECHPLRTSLRLISGTLSRALDADKSDEALILSELLIQLYRCPNKEAGISLVAPMLKQYSKVNREMAKLLVAVFDSLIE